MKVAICIKQVLDPELPQSAFRLNATGTGPSPDLDTLVLSPFDENAVEVAVQLKERLPGTHLTACSVGPARTDQALRKALAVGCDDALRIEGPDGRQQPTPDLTARLLAAALRQNGPFDLILCGRQAADWDMGLVGLYLAEDLGWPALTLVTGIAPATDGLRFRRDLPGGGEVVAWGGPALVTVTNADTNVLRMANFKNTMQASRRPIPVLTAAALGVAPAAEPEIRALTIPKRESLCELVTADSPEARAAALVQRLSQLGVI